MSENWLANYDEIVSFGHALVESHQITELAELQYYYEKPWKWEETHDSWVRVGRPVFDEDFTRWVDSLATSEGVGR